MPVGVVIKKGRIPVKCWMSQEELAIQPGAVEQALNLANHPIVEKWVCLMPDAHQGFGMPIGGVIATRGGVIPNAIGVDIGCGMNAIQTTLAASSLSREQLQEIRLAIHERVPVGNNHHKEPVMAYRNMPEPAGEVTRKQLPAGSYQLGTLGGGNHFIEVQADEQDRVWVMIHSGSRNLGKQVCDFYHNAAKKLMQDFHTALPEQSGKVVLDLAFLPAATPLYDGYLAEMEWCLTFAELSRLELWTQTVAAFAARGIKLTIDQYIETHHNFAAMEHHFGANYLVHRKGAVKAQGLVTIPGSMGTASYICRGLEPAESFNSCSHGAGRVSSRAQANRTITHERAVESMAQVVFGVREGNYDEMPDCYKDIHRVIELQADLVTPVVKLRPLAVVKG